MGRKPKEAVPEAPVNVDVVAEPQEAIAAPIKVKPEGYADWVYISPEEAAEAQNSGVLAGWNPLLGLALITKGE